MLSQAEKGARFRALHEGEGAFVIPNPWDAGSARILAALGFEALATTSAGFAQTLGRPDGTVTLEEKLEHIRSLSGSVEIPLSADLENGFEDDPEGVAATILRAAEAGAVGGSIEDHTRDPDRPIYDFEFAVERVHAAVEAARSLDFPFTLTARCENLLWKRTDLDDTVRRLQAFERAGADVLYAPGLTTLSQIREVASAVNRPLNVIGYLVVGATVAELAEAGAKRISVGPSFNRASIMGLIDAIAEVKERGSFEWTEGVPSAPEVAALMKRGADGAR